MTKSNPPHIPDSEPTEAAVMRAMLARMNSDINSLLAVKQITKWDKASLNRIRTEEHAIRACMKAAGWDTGEQPQEEQTILDAG